MRQVILDSNVIGRIAAAPSDQQDAALARLNGIRKEGAQILVTGTIVNEIAATHTHQEVLEKLLATIARACDGCLDLEAPDILKIELDDAEPHAIIAGKEPLPISTLDGLKDAVKHEEVKKFFAEGGFGNDGLRRLLEALDPIRKKVRDQIESFPEYVEARRIPCIRGFLDVSQERGHVVKKDWDVDALWSKGRAWRFAMLMLLANEYRRLTQTQDKGEGCLTDLRIVIESAYADEILTADKEFIGCGRLANKLVSTPVVSPW